MHAFYLSINTNKYIFTGKKIEVSTEKCGAIIYCASEKKPKNIINLNLDAAWLFMKKKWNHKYKTWP